MSPRAPGRKGPSPGDVIVDYREGSGIGIAPHFCTTDAEILSALDEIRDILETGALRAHAARRSRVT